MENRMIDEQRMQVLAAEIRVIQKQAVATVLTAACEIGKRLVEVKNGLPHGRFIPWLQENVEYSERQAQQMMALWEEYGKNPNPKALGALSVSQAVALLAAPAEVRDELIESGEAEGMSVRELKDEIRRQKKEISSRQLRIGELEEAVENEKKGKAEEAAKAVQAELELKELQRQKEQVEGERNAAIAARGIAERERDQAKADLTAELERAPEKIIEVEVTPPDIAEELERLRRIAREAPNKAVLLAREYYDQGRESFEAMISMLQEMPEDDRAKYAAAFAAGLRKMAEKVAQSA